MTPVTPKKERRPSWRERFLAELSAMPNVSAAARRAGVARMTAYRLRAKDPAFAAEWAEALTVGVGAAEDEAWRRGMRRKNPSDTLLIFMLRRHGGPRYRALLRYEGGTTFEVLLPHQAGPGEG